MVWSDNTAVAPFYVYDSNGNLIISVTSDNGLEVFDPANPNDKLQIKPGPAGAPTILLFNDGVESYELVATGSQGATQDVKSGTVSGEFHMVERAASTSANFRIGSAESVSDTGVFTNADYLEIRDGGLGTRRVWIQRYGGNYTKDSIPQGELELQPQAGTVTINGDTAADKVTIGAGAITADELDLNPSNNSQVNYNGLPITREVGATKNETTTGDITTETVTDSVTFAAVNGRTYEVEWTGSIDPGSSTPATNDRYIAQLREDGISGTIRDTHRHLWNGAFVQGKQSLRGRWTASSTGNKTFVVTWQRETGTANMNRFGAASRPSILTVKEVA